MILVSAVCPKLCVCSLSTNDGGLMLDCGNVGLNDIPDLIPDDVVVIDMSHNNITQLHNDSFANCANVTKLNLSSNWINMIHNSMLSRHAKLERN